MAFPPPSRPGDVSKEKDVLDSKIAAALRGSLRRSSEQPAPAESGDAVAEFIIAVTLPGTPERFTRSCSGKVLIGRGDDVDLQLAHPLVSRHHAELSLNEDGSFEVRDLGSRNGTMVNDRRLSDAVANVEGEVRLQIGPYLLLVSLPATTISETLAFDAPAVASRASLDKGSHALLVDGKVVVERLTGLEYGLLEVLAASAPNLVPNAQLGEKLWGKGQWDTYMLHNLVRRVRRKLEDAGQNAEEIIVTVPGVGYRLV
jgi:pSer/pThr/pTyr-binding forkhead associated (FHA) protein